MRVLCVCSLWPPYVAGGAELCTTALMETLARYGHSVSSASIGPQGCSPVEVMNGVTVYRIAPRNGLWFFQGRQQNIVRKAIWHLRDAWNTEVGQELTRIIGEVRPDVVHTHNIDGISPIVWTIAERMGVPTVHTAHDFHLLCPRTTLLHGDMSACKEPALPCRAYRMWHRSRAAKISVLTAPSRFVLDRHVEAGFTARHFRVVQNGIIPGARNVGADRRSPNGPLRLLYLGQLEPHKGLSTLLDAMDLLRDGADIALEIAGHGTLRETIAVAADGNPQIRYHGFVQGEAKRALLGMCHVLVQPSVWHEPGAPTIAAMEAYANSMAVIASNTGGLPEGVKHGETGLLVPADDARSLAIAIRSLHDDRTNLDRMRENARKASEYFSASRMADEYMSLYELLIGHRWTSQAAA